MVIFRKGRSSRKMEPVATPPIGLPHQRPSDQGASLPASTQHSILTWSAGLGCRPPGPPVWSPYPSGGWLLQGGTPPHVGVGRSARPLSLAQGPPSRARPLLHSTQAAPPVVCAGGRGDPAGTPGPQLPSPDAEPRLVWIGPAQPSLAEPPPAPEGREGCQAPVSPERTAPRLSPNPGPERGAEGARRARAAVPLW